MLAAGAAPSAQADGALAELCADYWYPLYAYVRQRGHAPEDARDLTQEFFAKLLEKHGLTAANPAQMVDDELNALVRALEVPARHCL